MAVNSISILITVNSTFICITIAMVENRSFIRRTIANCFLTMDIFCYMDAVFIMKISPLIIICLC